jgi:hypothetical protein
MFAILSFNANGVAGRLQARVLGVTPSAALVVLELHLEDFICFLKNRISMAETLDTLNYGVFLDDGLASSLRIRWNRCVANVGIPS